MDTTDRFSNVYGEQFLTPELIGCILVFFDISCAKAPAGLQLIGVYE